MKKIATHDSVTGESSYGILSYIGIPVAKTQRKTIKEQYEAGCRYFDIRVRYSKRGLICAHGLWQCKRLAYDILGEINGYGDCYVRLTYEGVADDTFINEIDRIVKCFPDIKFTTINTKYPQWKVLRQYNSIAATDAFIALDFTSWHTLLPIPILWKWIYYNKPQFNEEVYTMVDFL